jgi:DHA2 family multidrug resistance protein-like MFS transporter
MPFNPGTPASRSWFALAVLALPTLLVSMDMMILYLAAPSLSASLQPSAAQLLWISDSYAFAVGCVLIPMGALGDRIGRRRLLLCGSLGFGLASALAAFSTSPAMLIFARVLMGIAGATLLPSTLAMIRNLFVEPRQRGLAIGIWTTCFTLGGILGPLVGGLVLTHYWWGAVFLIGVPVMLALLLLGPVLLPEFRDPSAQRIDAPSVLLAVVTVLAITFAIKHTVAHAVTFTSAGAAVLGWVAGRAFLRRQRRAAHPLIDLDLFANRTFAAAIGANTLALFAWVGASLLVAQHLQGVLGMTPLHAGMWLVVPAVACVAGCLGAPLWAQRASHAHAVGGGLLLTGIGLASLSAATAHFGLAAIVTGMMVLGFGVSTIVTLGTDVVLGAAPAEKAGAAAALSETGADIGGAFGVAVLGSISAAVYRTRLVLPPNVDASGGAAVSDTLGAAADLASRLPAAVGAGLLTSAQQAFTAGLQWATAAGSVVLLAMTVVFAWSAWRSSPSWRDTATDPSGAPK